MQPGPCTYLNGSLRPVFFEEKDFRAWLSTIAVTDAQTDQQEIGDQAEGPVILLTEQEPEGREKKVVWHALRAKWLDGRVPSTTKTSEALAIVNAWIAKHRSSLEFRRVSRDTVARVLSRKK
jgi:hypothetical protein